MLIHSQDHTVLIIVPLKKVLESESVSLLTLFFLKIVFAI